MFENSQSPNSHQKGREMLQRGRHVSVISFVHFLMEHSPLWANCSVPFSPLTWISESQLHGESAEKSCKDLYRLVSNSYWIKFAFNLNFIGPWLYNITMLAKCLKSFPKLGHYQIMRPTRILWTDFFYTAGLPCWKLKASKRKKTCSWIIVYNTDSRRIIDKMSN